MPCEEPAVCWRQAALPTTTAPRDHVAMTCRRKWLWGANQGCSKETEVVLSHSTGVSAWEIPLVVKTSNGVMQFKDMARTLCPHDAGSNITSDNRPTITIATWNPGNVTVTIKLKRVQDFFVEVDKPINLSVTPSTPKYFFFSFDQIPQRKKGNMKGIQRFNYTIPKSVILIIESDDDVCAVVSIQNNSCPVFDNEQDMLYQGYHLTMTTKGGITLTQAMFPAGFYIVFIVKQTDDDCVGISPTSPPVGVAPTSPTVAVGPVLDQWEVSAVGGDGRFKNFRLTIKATISYREYVIGALVLIALVLVMSLFAMVVYIPSCQTTEEELLVEDVPGGSDLPTVSEGVPIINDDRMSDSEPEVEVLDAMPRTWTVADTSRASLNANNRRSNRYFWSALTVAVVYALPVVQLLYTYQQMVFQTGNQDLCYYNFLCAHPLGFLSDFNHVYSNVGYVVLGLAFMMQVRKRQLAARKRPQNVGIPQHHGLFYSMGLALVMEGLLSACYHLCPNKMNFQFDSSFMYVIAVLCMVKIYQNRHPDVNASAHSTFILIAFIMAIGVYGIMYPSVYFWVFFTIAHLITCFILTLKIYYVGQFKLGGSIRRFGGWEVASDALESVGSVGHSGGCKMTGVGFSGGPTLPPGLQGIQRYHQSSRAFSGTSCSYGV
ncbi:dsRNA-gated channel SID-1 domain-containing protein [Phthorimaea operculella]|nr:dsRNA-gated channel SID-1 domain-containing protein [Phthorimaea operculella]